MFTMTCKKGDLAVAIRSYYRASECVEAMVKAYNYYREGTEPTDILMRDDKKSLIVKINSHEEIKTSPEVPKEQ